MQSLRGEDGPPLPVDEQLRGRKQPEALHSLSPVYSSDVGVRAGSGAIPLYTMPHGDRVQRLQHSHRQSGSSAAHPGMRGDAVHAEHAHEPVQRDYYWHGHGGPDATAPKRGES